MPRDKAQRANLIGDCLILIAASLAATMMPGPHGFHWLVAIGLGAGAMLVWTLASRLLRHYDAFNGREVVGDVALTALQLAGLVAVLYALRGAVPRYAAGSDFRRFVAVALPAIAWLRFTTSWARRRDVEIQNVLIVGIGPLGRHTGLEIRDGVERRLRSSATCASPTNRCTIACRPR